MEGSPARPVHHDPSFDRIAEIVSDHLLYADRHPDLFDAIASAWGVSRVAALAIGIADEIVESFDVTAKTVLA